MRSTALCCFLFVTLWGCSSSRLEQGRPQQVDAALLWQRLLEQRERDSSAEASVVQLRGSVRSSQLAFGVSFRAVVAGQDSLRLELYGPLGMPVGMLYARPERFVFYDIWRNVVLEGRSPTAVLSQLLPLTLPYPLLLALLRQELPRLAALQIGWDAQHRLLVVRDSSGVVLAVDPESGALHYAELPTTDAAPVRVFLCEHRRASPPVAQRILVQSPQGDISIELQDFTRQPSLGMPLSFPLPENAPRLVLE